MKFELIKKQFSIRCFISRFIMFALVGFVLMEMYLITNKFKKTFQ